MNIFILDTDPKLAAQYHCDKHVIKQIVESCQLLSTAVRLTIEDVELSIYKTTHRNHPCTIWTKSSKENFLWLCDLTTHLLEEYKKRYNKIHKSTTVLQDCKTYSNIFASNGLTPFAVAIAQDKECRKVENFESLSTVEKYRLYYKLDKCSITKWNHSPAPEFLNN